MPTRIVLNENGFSSCNQKALDSDLRRINLSQRQYVSNYHAERRKVITRFARKLMLTGLNTNFDINNFQSTPEEPRKKNKILPPIREKSLLKVDLILAASSVSSRRSSMSDSDEVSIFKTETPHFAREISNISYVSKSQSNILQPSSVSAKSM